MTESDSCSVGPESHDASREPFGEFVVNNLVNGGMTKKLCTSGQGGTYIISSAGEPVAVFKPGAEEIGLVTNPRGHDTTERVGFTPGDSWKREILAFKLDHSSFAGVPETVEVTIEGQRGSLQKFIHGCLESWSSPPGRYSVRHVHRIAILDLRTLNCDRHGGNILVERDRTSLVPIDHAYILPECFSDPDFEWKDWPQSRIPFGPPELDYISRLDPEVDRKLVTDALNSQAGELIEIFTRVLMFAALRGYTPRQIASFCRREKLAFPSQLECLLADSSATFESDATYDLGRVDDLLSQYFPRT